MSKTKEINKAVDYKNIIIINENLDEYIDYLTVKNDAFNFILTNLNNLSTKIVKIENSLRENTLIIISKIIYNEKNKKKIKKIFTSKLNIPRPHYLILGENLIPETIKNEIDDEQNFYFPLNSCCDNKEELPNLMFFFLKMLFQRTRDISRLENYIVNAFRTIVDAEIINRQKQEIEKLYNELDELSKQDYLTKVLNRKAFFELMAKEMSRVIRKDKRLKKIQNKIQDIENTNENNHKNFSKELDKANINFSCVMIDIDHFKKINDTYGHLVGDMVLKELGEILKSKKYFRDNDIVGRYGGEEFIILLTETNASEAVIPVERFREQLKKVKFKDDNEKIFNITVSVGISEFRITDKSSENVVNRADKALYYAKENGRDQTIVYENVFKG